MAFRSLSAAEIAVSEVELARDGYTVLHGLMDDAGVREVLASLTALHVGLSFGVNEFGGLRTKRAFNLLGKTRILDELMLNPDTLDLVRSMLGIGAQLSIASTMEIFPGETEQALHRDDGYFPVSPHPCLVVNTMWALTDFNDTNGGTRIVPGSHQLGGPVNVEASAIPVEMDLGSVLLWDGQLWHGGGANLTDQARFGLSLNFCRGWIRQQENQYLSLDPALVRALPVDLQKLLGYDNCQFLGWADGRHPMRAIIPEVRADIFAGKGDERRPRS